MSALFIFFHLPSINKVLPVYLVFHSTFLQITFFFSRLAFLEASYVRADLSLTVSKWPSGCCVDALCRSWCSREAGEHWTFYSLEFLVTQALSDMGSISQRLNSNQWLVGYLDKLCFTIVLHFLHVGYHCKSKVLWLAGCLHFSLVRLQSILLYQRC